MFQPHDGIAKTLCYHNENFFMKFKFYVDTIFVSKIGIQKKREIEETFNYVLGHIREIGQVGKLIKANILIYWSCYIDKNDKGQIKMF